MSVAGGGSGPEQAVPPERATVLTVAAWVMLPLLLVTVPVGAIVGQILATVIGVEAGQSLVRHGVTGWLLLLVALVIAVLPLASGIWLSIKASREGAGGAARVATVVNALLLVVFVGSSLAGQILR